MARDGVRSAPSPEGDDVQIQRFTVTYDYPVCFTEDLFSPANPVFAETLARLEPDRRHRFVAFIDDGLAGSWPNLAGDIAAYADRHSSTLSLVSAPEFVPGGERAKNDPALVERLQRRLLDLAIDRHAYVAVVGGGAVLDLIGYVAATVHRGIRLIRVPTTVLAQNDSGVGVKNGVNAFGVKNLLGTFAPPFAVLIDSRFLDKLGARDKLGGMAEAVKVALIRDRRFFEWIESEAEALARFEPAPLRHLIRRCAELHMRHIATGGDPFESGSARPLDYGHWAAHKLEALTDHELRHGEAVAIGLALDAHYAVLAGMLPAGEDERIHRLLTGLGFTLWHPALELADDSGTSRILAGLREFREHLGGELTITLLAAVGRGVEVHAMDEATIRRAIGWLKAKSAR